MDTALAHDPAYETALALAKARQELRQASANEQSATLEALRTALGGTLPDPLPFSHEHVRALVNSAFMAGASYEAGRRASLDREVA